MLSACYDVEIGRHQLMGYTIHLASENMTWTSCHFVNSREIKEQFECVGVQLLNGKVGCNDMGTRAT